MKLANRLMFVIKSQIFLIFILLDYSRKIDASFFCCFFSSVYHKKWLHCPSWLKNLLLSNPHFVCYYCVQQIFFSFFSSIFLSTLQILGNKWLASVCQNLSSENIVLACTPKRHLTTSSFTLFILLTFHYNRLRKKLGPSKGGESWFRRK